MQIGIEVVTPEQAKLWLSHNINNRNVRRHIVTKYVRELLAGNWKLTHQGVAFNCDGSLKDGQHRLTAIAESGVSARMVVARGLQDEAVVYVDRGSKRGIHDNAKMLGQNITQYDIAIALVAMNGPGGAGHSSSVDEKNILEFIAKNQDAFAFVRVTKKKGLTQASVMAAFVRAYSYCSTERLSRCIGLFLNGMDTEYKPCELAIISFRDFCLRNDCRGYSQRVEFYQRTQRAIKAFMGGEELKLIKPCSDDLYPIRELI